MAGIDSFTKVMLHFDGVDGSTTMTDSELTPKTWTARSSAQIDTAQSKFGGASLLLPSGGASYVDTPDSADFDFSGGTLFTIDFQMRAASLANPYYYLWGQATDGQNAIYQYINSDGSMTFIVLTANAATVVLNSAAGAFTTGNFYHVALIRGWGGIANGWALTKDGNAIATTTDADSPINQTGNFTIGTALQDAGNGFDGWIDEFRISKGIARWTTTFTPPTAAYSPSGDPLAAPAIILNSKIENTIILSSRI